MDEATLKRLERTLRDAQQAVSAVERERSDLRYAREQEFREKLNAEIAEKFAVRLNNAMQARGEAQIALDAARVEHAKANDKGKFKIGQRLIEWSYTRWSNNESKTGRIGVVEVFTRDSVVPDNFVRRLHRPEYGALVIRLLKKDGTPSRKIEFSYNGEFHGWYPDGVNPNEAKS